MPNAAPVRADLANAQPAQQLAVLPERPNIDVALGEAREVSYAALDVDDGLGVARREGRAAGAREHRERELSAKTARYPR